MQKIRKVNQYLAFKFEYVVCCCYVGTTKNIKYLDISTFLPSAGLESGLSGLLPWHAWSMISAHAIKVMTFDMFCMNFKGDWKYIWQLFSLNRYATKEEAGVLGKNGDAGMLSILPYAYEFPLIFKHMGCSLL